IASIGLFASALFAQQDRIPARIDNGRAIVLRGHMAGRARPQHDQGPVNSSFQLPAITIFLRTSSAQQSALGETLADQANPASPRYHSWLTPDEYAQRFGASQSDVDKLVGWLESQGFAVQAVARSRAWITFSGSAQQVQRAFGTAIHRYNVNGRNHYANSSEASVPAALAPEVIGFRGLHDFHLKPRHVKRELTAE